MDAFVDLPSDINEAYDQLQRSAFIYQTEGLMDKRVCRYIVPSCLKEQDTAQKVMIAVKQLFLSTSDRHEELIHELDEHLQHRTPGSTLLGVRSMEPRTPFSVEMLLRFQNEATQDQKLALKVENAFNQLLLETLSDNKDKALLALNVFVNDLKAFTLELP